MGIIKQTIVKCDSCGVEAKCGSLNSFDAIAAMKRRDWVITFRKKEKLNIKCNGCAAAPLQTEEKRAYPFESLEAGIQYVNSLILKKQYVLEKHIISDSDEYFMLYPNPRGEDSQDSVYAFTREDVIRDYVIATARQMGYDWVFK